MLTIDQLFKKMGNIQAIDGLELSISEGQIVGLLGPNGAGKTTLIRLIMGLLKPDRGEIKLFGQYQPGVKEVRRLIGYMPQQLSVYPGLTVMENVLFYGRMYQMQNQELKQSCEQVLQTVELDQRRDDVVATLSGGMIRRVMLATALVHKPRLLILDEPTAGVDPMLRIRFWDWFKQMVKNGTSIIVTTHNISEADRCQNVIFLRNGQKLDEGTPHSLMQNYHCDNLESAFVAAIESRARKFNGERVN